MFWQWNPEYAFMDTEPGSHKSQRDSLNQRLFGFTFWGDYNGSIIERYHHDYLLRNAPNVVESLNAGHGKGLMLKDEIGNANLRGQNSELRLVIELVAFLDQRDYPIFDDSDFSDFQWELAEEELQDGWTGKMLVQEWELALSDITDDWDHLIPEQGSDEFWEVIAAIRDEDGYHYYWEGANDLIVEGMGTPEDAVYYLLSKLGPDYTQEETIF